MRLALLAPALLVLLAACGADGPPVAPQAQATDGIHISGSARVGIVYQE